MATSGQINSTMTARQVCQAAFRKLSVYGPNETMTADDASVALSDLNWMLKSWQSEGANLWRETDLTFPTVIGQATYALTPTPNDILEARITESNNPQYQRPLQRWGRGEYANIPNKTSPGSPTAYEVNRQRDTVSITLWPVPSQVWNVVYTADRTIEDVTDLEETIDVPQMWLECVVYNLAVRLYPSYGGNRIDDVRAHAVLLYNKMLDFDRPASVLMGSYY